MLECRKSKSHRCRELPAPAFSLIELLVVFATIAILAAMLLPTLSRAKEKSHRTVYKSNMRQVAMGAIMYAGENGHKFPTKLRRDNIYHASLDASNTPGLLANFNPAASYTWMIATASAGVSNFAASKLLLKTSSFSNAFTETFCLTNIGNTLAVAYAGAANPPWVSLGSPASNQYFTASATIPLSAAVTANGHTISQVQLWWYHLVGSSTNSSAYSASWTGVPAGQARCRGGEFMSQAAYRARRRRAGWCCAHRALRAGWFVRVDIQRTGWSAIEGSRNQYPWRPALHLAAVEQRHHWGAAR